MYELIFCKDKNGKNEVEELLTSLKKKSETSKSSRINFHKIVAYLDLLEELGTRVGEPVTKHLEGEIWELRPLKNRILYAYYKENKFLILTCFVKKTRKTPGKELKRAKRSLSDFLERNDRDE